MPGFRCVLLSTYEQGHQPLGLAAAAAALRNAGHEVACHDAAVDTFDGDWVRDARIVGISAPMHTAARLGIELARRVRQVNPAAHIAFYGLYSTPLREVLTETGVADSVLGGEYEPALATLANRLAEGEPVSPTDVPEEERRLARQVYPVPDRRGLPALERYARLDTGDELRLAGYVEASRGCAHTCTHCPITPVYGGRLRLVPVETTLADIESQVAMGARHITFGDPDFLNAVPHSLAICRELRRRHHQVTFDFTAKVEHLLEHEAALPEFRDLGCLFITSAFESTSATILERLGKGHSLADMEWVLEFAGREGLVIRPTWVAFTPWTNADDYLDLLTFVEEHGLVGHVQPVQYPLRLLLPPGSPLVDVLAREGRLGAFDRAALTHTWSASDPRMDRLAAELATIVESAGAPHAGQTAAHHATTFAAVKQAAFRALAGRDAPVPRSASSRQVPGLTENWFC